MSGQPAGRDAILRATGNGFAIFEQYLAQHFPGGRIEEGRHISNPFLGTPQHTPSFNVYRDSGGIWRFKDFAHSDCSGDCFELAARVNGINPATNFPDVLKRIEADCGLQPQDAVNQRTSKGHGKDYSIRQKPFSRQELDYWQQCGIDADILERFGVLSVSSYTASGRDGKSYTVRSSPNAPLFAYPYGEHAHKLYSPFAAKREARFRFVGVKPEGFIWGLEQLPEHGNAVMITAGEKDALAATAHGVHAVTLNSETARISSDAVRMLRSRADVLLCCYDIDETGCTAATRLWHEHEIIPVSLPCWIADGEGKDISDFFKLGGTKEGFHELITDIIANPPPAAATATNVESVNGEQAQAGSRFISLRELLACTESDEGFLIENILPAVGVSAIVGIPDVGKSQFTRHLALAIVTADAFLGLKVTPRHRRVIIVITEESRGQVAGSLLKQLALIPDVPLDAIEILFANTLAPDEIIADLSGRLREAPADAIIIDSFGDVFPGRDPNSSAEMRKALKPFDAIAQEFLTAVLFVNHLGKAGYRATPDQSQVINSAAFVQKCRSVIDLRYETHDPLTKFLSITKGNGVATAIKQRSMILRYNESALLFSFTGQYKLVSEINADPGDMERAQLRREAVERYQRGESVRTIAGAIGRAPSTVGSWVKGVRPGTLSAGESSGELSNDWTQELDSGQ
ncbi:MAG TPA: AAA family ATPase [Candidatus Kapabacteria bacterium]|nr:AAA family ATPase [Candidatus Kapabacteria bacterium]